MKPIFLKIDSSNCYDIREQLVAHVKSKYYYHPQLELVYFEKSDGMAIIGDKIQIIEEGDIFMLGQNLPHLFRNDEKFLNKKLSVRIIVLHFMPDFGGKEFLQIPDMKQIHALLKKSERGMLIKNVTRNEVGILMKKMLHADGPERVILLLQTLYKIALSKNIQYILPAGFMTEIDNLNEDRLNDVYSYTMQNFQKKIHTREIASIAHLSEHSFCRYFKNKTGKTYTSFLHEIRIKHACKLLSESTLNITQVIRECGFVNYSNFFRYFKQVTGKTPAEYQKISLETDLTGK